MKNYFSVSGKTILITGASSGIGKDLMLALAEQGAIVIGCARSIDKLETIIHDNTHLKDNLLGLKLDVTDVESIKAALSFLRGKRISIDALINNAGITIPRPFHELENNEWDTVLNTNLKSVWMLTKYVLADMNDNSSIINVSSILATRTRINASYCTSKAGLSHLTRCLAIELADKNIRVNAVAPGFVKTEMTAALLGSEKGKQFLAGVPLRRAASTDDLVGAVTFLASDAAAYMTGSVINVDGGLSANAL